MEKIVLAHRILVSLFLLQYVIKLALLLTGKAEQLAKYTKATRIVEILVSVGFLVTGIWLLTQMSNVSTLMVVKLVCVFASIPLAVIGFKKGNKALATLAVILIFASYGLAEISVKAMSGGKTDTAGAKTPIEAGQMVYQNTQCVTCHGADGKANTNGAKDLTASTLTMDEQKAVIKNGKGMMPPHPDLTDEQLKDVVEYISTLKK